MAIKHIIDYYATLTNQYKELLNSLDDMTKEVEQNIASPDMLDNLKAVIAPVKDSYMTISYIMYLLNMPNRPSKEKAYEKRQQKVVKSIEEKYTKKGIVEKNNKVLEDLKNNKEEIYYG